MELSTSSTIFTGTTPHSTKRWPRDTRIPGNEELPPAHATHIDVHKIGASIVADPATTQFQSSIPHCRSRNARQPDVNRFRLHVKAMLRDTSVRASMPQKLIAPRGAVSANHIDFAANIMNGSS